MRRDGNVAHMTLVKCLQGIKYAYCDKIYLMGGNKEFVLLVFVHPQVINLKSFNIDSMK